MSLRVKPLEIVKFNYSTHDVFGLTQEQVSQIIAENESIVCWTVGRAAIIQRRNRATKLHKSWMARVRRFSWSHGAAFVGRAIRRYTPGGTLKTLVENIWFAMQRGTYRLVSAVGGSRCTTPTR